MGDAHRRFALVMIALAAVVAVLPAPSNTALAPLIDATARMVSEALLWLRLPFDRDGAVLHHPSGFAYEIAPDCTGALVLGALATALLAYPTSWPRRLAGVAIAVPVVLFVNLTRLTHLFWIGATVPSLFGVAHDVVWRIADVGLFVLLWSTWKRWAERAAACGALVVLILVAGSAIAATPSLRLDHVEVTQAVQDTRSSIPLVAGRATVARVFLGIENADTATIRGRLVRIVDGIESADGPVGSANVVVVRASENGDLQGKRRDAARSLNFLLPLAWAAAGNLQLKLKDLEDTGPSGVTRCDGCWTTTTVPFLPDAPLRVLLVQISYSTAGSGYVSPRPDDLSLIESWLRRAYPGSVLLERSEMLMRESDLRDNSDQLSCERANAALTQKRRLDQGRDPRTHYYGIVEAKDTKSFMQGCSNAIPDVPNPGIVASGPAGEGLIDWDKDKSFGDWYAGHELAHALGRRHPGFCLDNSPDDSLYPYAEGKISDASTDYVGFDVGDPSNGVPMQALPGSDWYDVMTYCPNQWMSSYTYMKIRDRLVAESVMTAPPPAPVVAATSRARTASSQGMGLPHEGRSASHRASTAASTETTSATELISGDLLSVIASINWTKSTGQILYVDRVAHGITTRVTPDARAAEIHLLGSDDALLASLSSPIRFSSDRKEKSDEMGTLEALFPARPGVAKIELWLAGKVVDTRAFGPGAPAIGKIELGAKASTGMLGFQLGRPDATGRRTLSWDASDPEGDTLSYSIQRSFDSGTTWETIAVGLKSHRLELEPRMLGGKEVMLRVIGSDGFNTSQSVSEIFKVDEPVQ